MENSVSRRGFIQMTGSLGTATAVASRNTSASGAQASRRSHSGRRPEDYRLILQDIADPFTRMEWPPSPEKLVQVSVGQLKGSAVDAYAYELNHSGTQITHCSSVWPVVADDQPTLRSGSALRMNEAVKRLCREGHNPLAIMCDAAHKAGLDFFLRMRMNDLHDRVGDTINIQKVAQGPRTSVPEPFYYTPKWKREHPEWLIGDPQAPHPQASLRFWEAKAGNYAIGPFREMMYQFAADGLGQCDLDGFEIDFMRWPFLFPPAEAYAQRHIATMPVRRIRQLATAAGARRGRPVFLSARVPCTVELSLRTGIDLPIWLREGLLDMVTIGGGYLPFSTPWSEIGQLAAKAGIPALACLSRGKFPQGKGQPSEREYLRGAGYRALSSGMSGILLWNYFYEMEGYWRPGEEHGFEFTHDLVKSEFLRTARKSYALDAALPDPVYFAYAHANSPAQVPLMIGVSPDGIGSTVVFDVADEPSQAPDHPHPRLWIHLVNLGPEDRVQYFWNGRRVEPDPNAFAGITVFDHHEFEFDLAPRDVLRGENRLELRLVERSPRLDPYITLAGGRLTFPNVA